MEIFESCKIVFASPHYYDYPNSWGDYLKDRSNWDKKLFPKRLFEKKQRTIISPIEVGTKINVAGVYEYPLGTAGHVLMVRARITSGPHQGEIIDLPTSFGREGHKGPIWVIPEFYFEIEKNGLHYSSEFLESCPSNT